MPYTDDPEHVESDAVRFLLGDTNGLKPKLTDNEVDYLLNEQGSVLRAAARGAEILAGKQVEVADQKRVGSLMIRSFQSTMESYLKLAKALWARANAQDSTGPYAGGISRSDKRSVQQDGDRVRPSFARGMMHYPHGSNSSAVVSIEERLSSDFDQELL
jgi:hypothetical protein